MENLLLSLLVNSGSGGLTGYLTNSMALKMIFKKVMGVGGVIPSNYRQFREGVGRLVADHLLTPETLSPSLSSPQFRNGVKEGLKEGLTRLKSRIENYTLLQLLGEEFGEELKREWEKRGETIADSLAQSWEKIEWRRLEPLPPELVEEILAGLTKEWGEVKLGDLLPSTFWDRLRGVVEGLMAETQLSSDFIKKVERVVEEELKKGVEKGVEKVIQTPISDLFPFLEEGIKKFLDRIERELNNPSPSLRFTATKLGEETLRFLKVELRRVRLGDFINRGEWGRFKRTLSSNLTLPLLWQFERWLEREREWWEAELEKSINRSLSNHTVYGFIDGKLIVTIKELFRLKLSRLFKVVDKLKEAMWRYGQQSGEYLVGELDRWLNSYTLTQLVEQLERSGIVTPASVGELYIDILKGVLAGEGKERVAQLIVEALEKGKRELIKIAVEKGVEEQLPTQLSSLLKSEKTRQKLGEAVELLKEVKLEKLLSGLRPLLESPFSSFNFSSLPPSLFKRLGEEGVNRVGEVKVKTVWEEIAPEKRVEKWEEWINSQIPGLLSQLPPKLVASQVERELERFSPDQLGELAEQMFGKELRPINLLGGILGAGAGGVYGALALTPSPFIPPLLFAATGIATNYLAIKMIFRPYRKKKWLPFFSPGVIIKKQGELAESLSRFISSEILEEERIIERLRREGRDLVAAILKNWDREQYAPLRHWIEGQLPVIREELVKQVGKRGGEIGYQLLSQTVTGWSSEELISNFNRRLPHLLRQVGEKVGGWRVEQVIFPLPSHYFYFPPSQLVPVQPLLYYLNREVVTQFQLSRDKSIAELLNQRGITKTLFSKSLSQKLADELRRIEWKELLGRLSLWDTPLSELGKGEENPLLKRGWGEVKNWLKRQLPSLRNSIVKEITTQYPLAEGAKPVIEEVVGDILSDLLPRYLERIEGDVFKFIRQNFLNTSLRELELDRLLSFRQIGYLLAEEVTSPQFSRVLEQGGELVWELLRHVKLGELLHPSQLVPAVEQIGKVVLSHLLSQLNQLPHSQWGEVVKLALLEIAGGEQIGKFIPPFYWEEVGRRLNRDYQDRYIETLQLLEKNLKMLLLAPSCSQWQEALKRELGKGVSYLFSSTSTAEEILQMVINSIPSTGWKRVARHGVLSITAGIESHLPQIVSGIQLEETIKRAVMEMDGPELEEMFYSFARPYFNRLIAYGGVGGLFSLPTLLLSL